MQITHSIFVIFCLLPLKCTEACISSLCHKPEPWPTSKPWSTKSPSTPRPLTTPSPRPRPSTITRPKPLSTPSPMPRTLTIPSPITTIATLPWNNKIRPVINPNMDDKPVNFACTISTDNAEPLCSASIISLHFVVTSCLCLQENMLPRSENSIRVLIGGFIEYYGNAVEISLYEVDRVVLHPYCLNHGAYSLKNDIGLVMTGDEIEYTDTIGAATIPEDTGYQPNINKNWFLSAFRPKNTIATSPRESIWFVKVRYVPPKICSEVLNSSFYDSKYNFCTPYHHVGGSDTCEEDLGAALSLDNSLIGILIHKYACGRAGSAGSYVNVAIHRRWLNEMVQKLSNYAESV